MPFTALEETPVIVGAIPSTASAAFAPSEPEAPGVGSVSVALFVAESRIVPPLSDSADTLA